MSTLGQKRTHVLQQMTFGSSREQFVQQRLRLFQIGRVEAFSEPAVYRSEQLASLLPSPLIAPEPSQRIGRVQLRAFGGLRSCDIDCHSKARLCRVQFVAYLK